MRRVRLWENGGGGEACLPVTVESGDGYRPYTLSLLESHVIHPATAAALSATLDGGGEDIVQVEPRRALLRR